MSRQDDTKPTITQNNYNAHNVTGMGDIYSQYSAPVQLIQVLQQAIERDPDIPTEQKKNLLGHFRAILENPYFSGLVTSGVYEGLKAAVEHFAK
jgi:hypothetical protein